MAANPTDGLLAYWTFEEIVEGDTSNSVEDKNGTADFDLKDASQSVAVAAGSVHQTNSCQFTSDDDKALSVATNKMGTDWPGMANCEAYSLGVLVKPSALATNDVFAGKETSFPLMWVRTGGAVEFWHRDALNVSHAIPVGTFSTGTWYYCVITWDGSTVRAYVNGAAIETTKSAATCRNASTPLVFGALRATGLYEMSGLVDEGFVYSRALSAAEVAEIHADGISEFLVPIAETAAANAAVEDARSLGGLAGVSGTLIQEQIVELGG